MQLQVFFFSPSSPLRLLLLQKPRGSAVGNPNTGTDGVLCPFIYLFIFLKMDHFGFRSFVALAAVQLWPLFVLRAPMWQRLRNQNEVLLRRRDIMQTAAYSSLIFLCLLTPKQADFFFAMFFLEEDLTKSLVASP